LTPSTRSRRRRSRFAGPRRTRLKFYLLTGLLVAAVALVVVPVTTRIIESLMGFDPGGYDPKDFARTGAVTLRGVTELFSGTEAIASIVFLMLCVLFFMRSRRD
jgi:hypothetical protein